MVVGSTDYLDSARVQFPRAVFCGTSFKDSLNINNEATLCGLAQALILLAP